LDIFDYVFERLIGSRDLKDKCGIDDSICRVIAKRTIEFLRNETLEAYKKTSKYEVLT